MATTLDAATIRMLPSTELSAYLRDAIVHHGSTNVSNRLWHLIELGSLPPDALHIFFSICPDPEPIVQAMSQNVSSVGRKAAIRHFGRWTKTEDKFSRLWNSIGGTQGLLQLMARLSVDDVERVCRAIQQNTKPTNHQQDRRIKMTELYTSLTSSSKQASDQQPPFQNPDTRPLNSLYQHIASACTSEFFLQVTPKDCIPSAAVVKVHHTHHFRQNALDAIFATPPNPERHVSDYTYALETDREFAFRVLERLSNSPVHLEHNAKCIVSSLIVPLASLLANRREKQSVQLRFYKLVLKCVESSSDVASTIDMSILALAIRAWRLCRKTENPMDEILGKLIYSAPADVCSSVGFIVSLLHRVAPPSRLPLLKIILRSCRKYSLDLDADPEEIQKKVAEMRCEWNLELFYLLPSRASFKLFQKIHANGQGEHLQPGLAGSAALSDPEPEDSRVVDFEALSSLLSARANLQNGAGAAQLESARKALEYRKKKAEISREPEARVKWAKSSLLLSAAIGYIDVYANTLHWARRFNRDPLVIWDLLNHETLSNREAISLLSGVPQEQFFVSQHKDIIPGHVIQADKVVMDLIENASTISLEPGFQLYKANEVLDLPGKVVRERCKRTCALVEHHGVDEDWVQQHVWAPTLNFLLKVEQFLLADGRVSLCRTNLRGPLHSEDLNLSAKHVLIFLDNLAKRRDELWAAHRSRHQPAAITLPAPWPRGLPIAKLGPASSDHEDLVMPYLRLRVEAVVFISGATALAQPPNDPEELEAIGNFVDSYDFALRFYVSSGPVVERAARAAKAWSHAIKELTGDRMSQSEAVLYWKRIFVNSGIDEKDMPIPSEYSQSPIQFPVSDDPSEPTEWSPQSEPLPSRQLTTTILDCMHSATLDSFGGWSAHNSYNPTSGTTLDIPKTELHPEDKSIWSSGTSPKLLSVGNRDALMVVAICSLNAIFGAHSLSLTKPYPSVDNARIPAIYLDEEFLERNTKDINNTWSSPLSDILKLIDRFSASFPNTLLLELARSLLARMEKDELEDKPNPNVRTATLAIIKRITRGEQPATACDLVQHIILERPDDSSWHRQVLGQSFLQHLPAEDAKLFFSKLSEGVEKKLQLARKSASQKPAATEDVKMVDDAAQQALPTPKPTVKLTTVKMIAQTLRYARFVGRGFGLEKLTSLLRNSVHPDVIICIVESLLELREETDDQSLKDAVVDIVAKNIVPIAASLTERRALSEKQWQDMEAGDGDIPEHYDINCQQLPPLFERLVTAAKYSTTDEDVPGQKVWMDQVILPIIRLSTDNQHRWNKLFLQRNGLPLAVLDVLPPVPARIKMLLDPFEFCPQFLPNETMDVVERLVKTLETPPKVLWQVCNAIKKNAELKKTPAARYWLETWQKTEGQAQSGGYAHNRAMAIFTSRLRAVDHGSATDGLAGITVSRIQRLVVSHARRYVRQNQLNQFDQLIRRLKAPARYGLKSEAQAGRKRWQRNHRPILQHIIDYIEGLRTSAWEHDPLRQPENLPSTQEIEIELFLHTYRRGFDEQVSHDEYTACFKEFMTMLRKVIARSALHSDSGQVQTLKGAVQQVYGGPHSLVLALWVGQLSTATPPEVAKSLEARTQDNIRVEIAQDLLLAMLRNATSRISGWDMLAWSRIETANLVPAGATAGAVMDPYELAAGILDRWIASPEDFIRDKATRFYTAINAIDIKRTPHMEQNPLWIAIRNNIKKYEALKRERARDAPAENELENEDFVLEGQVSGTYHDDGDVIMADDVVDGQGVNSHDRGHVPNTRAFPEGQPRGRGGMMVNRGRGSVRGRGSRGVMRGTANPTGRGRGGGVMHSHGWPYSFPGTGRGKGRGMRRFMIDG